MYRQVYCKLSPDVFSWLQRGSKHFTPPFWRVPHRLINWQIQVTRFSWVCPCIVKFGNKQTIVRHSKGVPFRKWWFFVTNKHFFVTQGGSQLTFYRSRFILHLAPGQLIVGGSVRMALSSVELFPRPSSDACSVPELPQGRTGTSLSLLSGGRLVVCGGYDGSNWLNSCLSWVAGNTSWTHIFTLK